MNLYNSSVSQTPIVIAEERAKFMSRVYLWMSGGILTTAIVSTFFANNPEWINQLMRERFLFWMLMIAEFGMVIYLTAAINRITAAAAMFCFLAYAMLNGVTLSFIFLIYTRESIANVFGVTSIAFAGLSSIGYLTKRDLGPVGTFCTFGLFGLVGYGLLSFIFPAMLSEGASFVYSIIGLLVFGGLTAYDTQKIKAMNIGEGGEIQTKGAIIGALTLYLDFINLFLNILRLTGRRR